MSLTKENLEAEKQEKSNQMDQDYWAEKGTEHVDGLLGIEQELRNDLQISTDILEITEEEMKNIATKYGLAKMDYIKAGEALAKFLEGNPAATNCRKIAGVDFGPTLDALDGLTTLK